MYAGWYSVRDEAFYTEAELVDGKAPSGGTVVKTTVRERLHMHRHKPPPFSRVYKINVLHVLFRTVSMTKLPSLRFALRPIGDDHEGSLVVSRGIVFPSKRASLVLIL